MNKFKKIISTSIKNQRLRTELDLLIRDMNWELNELSHWDFSLHVRGFLDKTYLYVTVSGLGSDFMEKGITFEIKSDMSIVNTSKGPDNNQYNDNDIDLVRSYIENKLKDS